MPDVTVSVVVTLAQASVSVGGSTQAMWRVTTDGNDNALDTKSVVWSSLSPAVATVDPVTGLVRGVAAGSSVIRAAVGTVAGSATVTVQALPVVDITAAGYALINGLAVGASFELRGPVGTGSFLSQKQP